MSAVIDGPFCTGCGARRAPGEVDLPPGEQSLCPSCGRAGLTMTVQAFDTVGMTTDSATATLIPADASNDWSKRWRALQRQVPLVTGPRTSAFGTEEIHDAERELLECIGSCYHLKDILIQDGVLPKDLVERGITDDPDLALLADLANLDKHHQLNRPPRSGHVPVHRPPTGTTGSDKPGWTVNVTFDHDGTVVDAAAVIVAAIRGWRRFLAAHGLA